MQYCFNFTSKFQKTFVWEACKPHAAEKIYMRHPSANTLKNVRAEDQAIAICKHFRFRSFYRFTVKAM